MGHTYETPINLESSAHRMWRTWEQGRVQQSAGDEVIGSGQNALLPSFVGLGVAWSLCAVAGRLSLRVFSLEYRTGLRNFEFLHVL